MHSPIEKTSNTSSTRGAQKCQQGSSAPTWLTTLAKSGYAARGVIYVVVGSLAFLSATGQGGEKTDTKGAIASILDAPGGNVILWILVAGLIGYSAWRFVQSILDADDHGTNGKGLLIRGGLFISACTHIALAYTAGQFAVQSNASSGGNSRESLVAKILSYPGGAWIVALIGLAIAGAGVAHFIKAAKEKYKENFDANSNVLEKINSVCKFGLYSRGVVFLIIAGMFVFAAMTQNPDNAGGLKDVLDKLSNQSYGPYLLGTLALGLLSFGTYSLIEALYRKISYN